MKNNNTNIKKEHASDHTCSICGLSYKGFSFKNGYVCESCLRYIKESVTIDYDLTNHRT